MVDTPVQQKRKEIDRISSARVIGLAFAQRFLSVLFCWVLDPQYQD